MFFRARVLAWARRARRWTSVHKFGSGIFYWLCFFPDTNLYKDAGPSPRPNTVMSPSTRSSSPTSARSRPAPWRRWPIRSWYMTDMTQWHPIKLFISVGWKQKGKTHNMFQGVKEIQGERFRNSTYCTVLLSKVFFYQILYLYTLCVKFLCFKKTPK